MNNALLDQQFFRQHAQISDRGNAGTTPATGRPRESTGPWKCRSGTFGTSRLPHSFAN